MTLIEKFRMAPRERAERIAFLHLQPEDLALLASLRPLMEQHIARLVEEFYAELLRYPEAQKFFAEQAILQRVAAGQRGYLLSLFSGTLDEPRWEMCLHIGQIHERLGVPLKWYAGSMANFHERLVAVIGHHGGLTPAQLLAAVLALSKVMNLDLQLALESYASLSLRARQLGQQLQSTARQLNQAVHAMGQADE